MQPVIKTKEIIEVPQKGKDPTGLSLTKNNLESVFIKAEMVLLFCICYLIQVQLVRFARSASNLIPNKIKILWCQAKANQDLFISLYKERKEEGGIHINLFGIPKENLLEILENPVIVLYSKGRKSDLEQRLKKLEKQMKKLSHPTVDERLSSYVDFIEKLSKITPLSYFPVLGFFPHIAIAPFVSYKTKEVLKYMENQDIPIFLGDIAPEKIEPTLRKWGIPSFSSSIHNLEKEHFSNNKT